MTILLTGGAGYIGTHTAVELLNAGHTVVIADNYSNSSPEAVRRVEQITAQSIPTYEIDICEPAALDRIFTEQSIDAVIHFAGLKAVSESIAEPLRYYQNNLVSTLVLLETMLHHHVQKLVFSSSATVYGQSVTLPLTETSPAGSDISNPYGQTKYMIEQIIRDVTTANPSFEATILRYFNPIGAHSSGLIGEDPKGIPNNLMPYVAQVAAGKRPSVGVFGNDYPTPDGTGVRDFIHVVDLARGHLAALEHSKAGAHVYNLGTGHGTSVLELIDAFSRAAEKDIPYDIKPQRDGDIAACWANVSKANHELNWHAEYDIEQACRDTWRWQLNNPDGYRA